MRAIASIPVVQWGGWLHLELPAPRDAAASEEELVAASQHQLHQSIAVLAPLARKGLKSVWLDIGSPYCRVCGETVAALAAAFGAALAKLHITLQSPSYGQPAVYSSMSSTFWPALVRGGLPRLTNVVLSIEDTNASFRNRTQPMARVGPEGLQHLVAVSSQYLDIEISASPSHGEELREFKASLRAIRHVNGGQSSVRLF